MIMVLKNLLLPFIIVILLGCSNNPGRNTHFNKNNYSKFVKTISFGDSFNEAINEIVGENFSRENLEVSPLSGGMTSTKIFLVTLKDRKWILRTLNPKHDMVSKMNEIRAHNYAAKIGLAPPLDYVDKKFQFMMMPYVEGHTLNLEDLRDPKVLMKIGKSLAKLHRYQKGEFNQYRPQIDRAKKHFERAQKKEVALPSIHKELYEKYYKEGIELNKNAKDLVLCHADLNPANIIIAKNGAIYFIDWTSATLDNRYTDLGYFSLVNGLSDDQSRILLSAYFANSLTDFQWKMFRNAQRRTSFLTATVWFDFSESKQDKIIPKKERIKKLDTLLEDPRLKTGLEYAASHEVVSPTSGSEEVIRLYALGFLKTYRDWK